LLDSSPKAPTTEDEQEATEISAIGSAMANDETTKDSSSPEETLVSLPNPEKTMAGQVLSALASKISEANLPFTASSQGIPTTELVPVVYIRQVVSAMAPRSPRKRLSEKAASMRCLSKGPVGASNQKVPSRGLSRSMSVASLDPMESPLFPEDVTC
jgi:hypothetical protein